MTILKNRKFAGLFCAVVIVLSTIILGSGDLNAIYKEINTTSFTVLQNDLGSKNDYAGNLVTISKRYTDGNSELTKAVEKVEDVRGRINELNNSTLTASRYSAGDYAKLPAQLFALSGELTAACEDLSEVLKNTDISESDEGFRVGALTNMESVDSIISHSTYNDEATAYNNKLNGFPAFVFKLIGMVKTAQLYGA